MLLHSGAWDVITTGLRIDGAQRGLVWDGDLDTQLFDRAPIRTNEMCDILDSHAYI
jgi:hypothetical protein